jgi:hypothetical protein
MATPKHSRTWGQTPRVRGLTPRVQTPRVQGPDPQVVSASSAPVIEFGTGLTGGAAPTGIAASPDGNVWFTEATGNRVGWVTPSDVITEFPSGITTGASPNAIAAGPDGNLWFSELTGNRIARIGSGVDVLVLAPAVHGSGRVGERALRDEGAWKASLDVGGYGFQWTLDGADLAGATGATYVPVAGDETHLLGCRVAAHSASVLALYAAQSAAIAVGIAALGPAGASGTAGAAGPSGAATAGAGGTSALPGTTGAAGAAATANATATLLHARIGIRAGRRFTVRYIAGRGMKLVLLVRPRKGIGARRLAALTTRTAGRGSISVGHAPARGAYMLVLTLVGATGARVVDAIPLVVAKA